MRGPAGLTTMRSAGAALGAIALAACTVAEPPAPVATHVEDWRDEVVYQIVVDRFDNGDPANDWHEGIGVVPGDLTRFQGGDWAGVRGRLGYLERLGATTLWLSPVVANVSRTAGQDGYHGYWASDFTEVNPRFGTLDELRALVRDAHDRGMKVILDVVVNHAGRVFYYDVDRDGVLDGGELEPAFDPDGIDAPVRWLQPAPRVWTSAGATVALEADDFHRHGGFGGGGQREKELGDFPTGLRDLDTESDAVLDAMVATYARWVELTDVDGFRLDAVPHVPHAAWLRFATDLRARLAAIGKHRFLLLGEVFDADPEVLAGYTSRGGLDAAFDFSLKADVIDGFLLDGEPAATAIAALEDNRAFYDPLAHENGVELNPWQARLSFADNHDVPRLRYWIDDPWLAELAMTVVFTVDAIPAVYYGTEQGFDGGWGDASREVLWEAGFAEDGRTFRHIQRLAEIRAASEALRRGALEVVYASDVSARESAPGAGLLAWQRHTADERVLVAVCGHPRDEGVAAVPTGFAPGTDLVDHLGSHPPVTVAADGTIAVRLPPRTAAVFATPNAM